MGRLQPGGAGKSESAGVGDTQEEPAMVWEEGGGSMRKINGADFFTARELAEILGYDEVQIGAFGVFCRREEEVKT